MRTNEYKYIDISDYIFLYRKFGDCTNIVILQWNLFNTSAVNANFRIIRTNIWSNTFPYNVFSNYIPSVNSNYGYLLRSLTVRQCSYLRGSTVYTGWLLSFDTKYSHHTGPAPLVRLVRF